MLHTLQTTPLGRRQCSDNTHIRGSGHCGTFFFVHTRKVRKGPMRHLPFCSRERKKRNSARPRKKKQARIVRRSVVNALQTLTPRTLASTAQFKALCRLTKWRPMPPLDLCGHCTLVMHLGNSATEISQPASSSIYRTICWSGKDIIQAILAHQRFQGAR